MLVGLGAGATIPYLNLFIEGKFHISYASLGSIFAWTSLATAVTVLIQPALVKWLGQLRAVLVVQMSSLPFLAMLGFSPFICNLRSLISIWIAVDALNTKGHNICGHEHAVQHMYRPIQVHRRLCSKRI